MWYLKFLTNQNRTSRHGMWYLDLSNCQNRTNEIAHGFKTFNNQYRNTGYDIRNGRDGKDDNEQLETETSNKREARVRTIN